MSCSVLPHHRYWHQCNIKKKKNTDRCWLLSYVLPTLLLCCISCSLFPSMPNLTCSCLIFIISSFMLQSNLYISLDKAFSLSAWQRGACRCGNYAPCRFLSQTCFRTPTWMCFDSPFLLFKVKVRLRFYRLLLDERQSTTWIGYCRAEPNKQTNKQTCTSFKSLFYWLYVCLLTVLQHKALLRRGHYITVEPYCVGWLYNISLSRFM